MCQVPLLFSHGGTRTLVIGERTPEQLFQERLDDVVGIVDESSGKLERVKVAQLTREGEGVGIWVPDLARKPASLPARSLHRC